MDKDLQKELACRLGVLLGRMFEQMDSYAPALTETLSKLDDKERDYMVNVLKDEFNVFAEKLI